MIITGPHTTDRTGPMATIPTGTGIILRTGAVDAGRLLITASAAVGDGVITRAGEAVATGAVVPIIIRVPT